MVQEFRYATPGGLMIFFISIGAYILDQNIFKNLGAFAGVLSILVAIPVGWIVYQWQGFITYRRGGLESYWETIVLKDWWRDNKNSLGLIPFMNSQLIVNTSSLSEKLNELGQRYFTALSSTFPDREFSDKTYLSPLHDIIFAGQREHEYPRGQYGIHNTLTMIYFVVGWGVNFLAISLIMLNPLISSIPQRYCNIYGLIWITAVVLIFIAFLPIFFLTKRIDRFNFLPEDHVLIFAVMYSLSFILSFMGIKGYLIVVAVFFSYLLYKSRIPWKMLKIEAELREELLTWLYIQKCRKDTDISP